MTLTVYLLSFGAGLLGGFGHCLGMCGPLVASYALHGGRGRSGLVPHLLYNAGRITTYSFIGALMGLGGSFLNTAGRLSGVQHFAAALTGVLMVLMGLSVAGLFKGAGLVEKKAGLASGAARLIAGTGSPWRYYPLGLLFGFIPCGLSYSIFLGAAGSAGLPQGMLYALSFGLGTLPALLLFGVVVGYLGGRLRGLLYRASGVAVILSGIYFMAKSGIFDARM